MLRSQRFMIALCVTFRVLIFASTAWAQDQIASTAAGYRSSCSTIEDLSKDLGEVYNQKGLDWCYAYTAADLITQSMHQGDLLSKKDRIHPLSVGGLHHISDGRSPGSSRRKKSTLGDTLDLLKKAKADGYKICKESDFGKPANFDHPLFMQATNEAIRKVKKDCNIGSANVAQLPHLHEQIRAVAKEIWAREIKKRCKTDVPDYEPEVIFFEGKYNLLANQKFIKMADHTFDELQMSLDTALESGKMAGIEYQASFLRKKKTSAMHWSSVVARKRFPDGKCYYKVRDTLGDGCKSYVDPSKCEKGRIWVEADDLLYHMDQVTYLK